MSDEFPARADEPTARRVSFEKGRHLFKRFWPFLRLEKKAAVAVGILLLLGLPAEILPPFLVGDLLDGVMAKDGPDAAALHGLIVQGGVLVGLTLLSSVLGYARTVIALGMRARVSFRVLSLLYRRVGRLPLRFVHGSSTGYLMARLREDVKKLDQLMLDRLLEAAVEAAKAVICFVLLLTIDLGLALAGLTLVAVIFGGVLALSPALRRRSERSRESDARVSDHLHEFLTGMVTVRTTAQERRERRRMLSTARRWIRDNLREGVLGAITVYAVGMIGILGAYVIIVVAAWRILLGLSTFGSLMTFFLVLLQMMSGAGTVMALVPGVQISLVSLQRIFALLDEHVEEDEPRPEQAPRRPRGHIEFRRVSLSYQEGEPVLREVNLQIRAGEVVALVGPSGAGKTSLVHLIPRLYEPNSGEILLDGRPLPHYPLEWLRRQIGVVPQDVFLFHRSIRENLAYATPHASDEEVRAAARAARADGFIEALPKGYETDVGERGVRVSGGEAQRLAIARELLRDPPILILDEATSHLDSENEVAVREAIRGAVEGRTCLLIAHRFSTILDADRVVVLERGRVVEEGRLDELLAHDGPLCRMRDLQMLEA